MACRANADEGWRGGEGGQPNADHCWRGGRGVFEPPILDDVICEQPHIDSHLSRSKNKKIGDKILSNNPYLCLALNLLIEDNWMIDDSFLPLLMLSR